MPWPRPRSASPSRQSLAPTDPWTHAIGMTKAVPTSCVITYYVVNSRAMAANRPRANDPTLLILTSLASGEKHGYALLQDIEQFAGVTLGPGTLYGAIGRLEERSMIESTGDAGRRRPYRLTAAGAQELTDTLDRLRAITTEGSRRLTARRATVGGTA
jgi:DNA-binding PadR family transcriptional regulator